MTYRKSGEDVTTTTIRNGVVTTRTQKETQLHCDGCDAVIPEKQEEDIEVWVNYPYSESDIFSFCDYGCLANWAKSHIKEEMNK